MTKSNLQEQLTQARADHAKATVDAATYKRLYESQQSDNGKIREQLQHQERLVRTLLDVLADRVHPIPATVNVKMDYRVAK
jgi:hypothetical protein